MIQLKKSNWQKNKCSQKPYKIQILPYAYKRKYTFFNTYRIEAIDMGKAVGHYHLLIFTFLFYFDLGQSGLFGDQRKRAPEKINK